MKKLILLILIPLGLGMLSCNKLSKKDPCADEVLIAQLQVENAYLKNENLNLKQLLADCEASKTTPATTTTRRTTIRQRAAQPATQPSVAATPARDPVPQTTASTPAPRVGVANLDYLRQSGEILFCVSANNREDRYFPDFAIQRGVTFVGTTDNAVKGYNWKVEPTEFMEGDYGVTFDGTFYVSDQLLKTTLQAAGENLSSVEIKAPYTRWAKKSMTFDSTSGYWVFHTQR